MFFQGLNFNDFLIPQKSRKSAKMVPKVVQNGYQMEPNWCPGATLAVFEKVLFYLSKTYVFEVPGHPESVKKR